MLSTPPAIISSASPALDGARGGAHRVHARAAQAVDGGAGHARSAGRRAATPCVRRCGCPRRPGWRSRRSRRHRSPVDLRVARHQRLQRDRAKVVGAHRRQRAAVAADRRANGVADEGFRLSVFSSSSSRACRGGEVAPVRPLAHTSCINRMNSATSAAARCLRVPSCKPGLRGSRPRRVQLPSPSRAGGYESRPAPAPCSGRGRSRS